MLSFVYQLVNRFESSHGYRPNLLYINPTHLKHLQNSFAAGYDLVDIMEMFKMEFVVDSEALHPHVAWTSLMLAHYGS
jgi:hypothetical protein